MSQFFFYPCQSDGKQRISFTYPPHFPIFWRKAKNTLTKLSCDELNDYYFWISTNKEKRNRLVKEFLMRIYHIEGKIEGKRVFFSLTGTSGLKKKPLRHKGARPPTISEHILTKKRGSSVDVEGDTSFTPNTPKKKKKRKKLGYELDQTNP
jgi:hypothetical protein